MNIPCFTRKVDKYPGPKQCLGIFLVSLHKDINSSEIRIIDTSYFEFPGQGGNKLFTEMVAPPLGINHIVDASVAHIRNLNEELKQGKLCVPHSVIVEMSTRLQFFDGRLRYLLDIGNYNFRIPLTRYKSAYGDFVNSAKGIERNRINYDRPSLDPAHWLRGDDFGKYEKLMDVVRMSSPDLYLNNPDGKYHSEQSRKLETDRRVAASALFFSQFRPVTMLANDNDISNVLLDTNLKLDKTPLLDNRHPITRMRVGEYTRPPIKHTLVPEVTYDGKIVSFPTQKSTSERVA